MPVHSSFDYAIVRVVPHVERGEFVNVGVILFCRTRRYLEAKIELDRRRVLAIAPQLDLDEVTEHLSVIPRVAAGGKAAGPIGQLPLADRFHWLVAPRSAMIQISPVHCGRCADPATTLERLMDQLVRTLQVEPGTESYVS